MNKFKAWLCGRFLPAWCREELLDENKRLTRRVADLKAENARLNAYLDGMETALRLGRRVSINTGEVVKQ